MQKQVVDFSTIYYMATQVMLIDANNLETVYIIEAFNKSSIRIGAQLGSIQQTYAEDIFKFAQKTIYKPYQTLSLA